MKLWEGRFSAPMSADADSFNESLSFDKKLYQADIAAGNRYTSYLIGNNWTNTGFRVLTVMD